MIIWLTSDKTNKEYTEYNVYKRGILMGGITHHKDDDFWQWWVEGVGKKKTRKMYKEATEEAAKRAVEYEI